MNLFHRSRILPPLFWTMLNQQGNSNSNERIDLLEHFERVFPDAKVRCLVGDRESVGKDWCSYLLLPKTLPFPSDLRLRPSFIGLTRTQVNYVYRG